MKSKQSRFVIMALAVAPAMLACNAAADFVPGALDMRVYPILAPGSVRSDGYRYSWSVAVAPNGRIAASAEQFSGMTGIGPAIFLIDPATSIATRVGFSGLQWTNTSGVSGNFCSMASEQSRFFVVSAGRYNGGSNSRGVSTSIVDSVTGVMTDLSLADAIHTQPNGTRESYVRGATPDDRFVFGQSLRATSATSDFTAWSYDTVAQSRADISLTSAGYVSSAGVRSSTVGGNVPGTSVVYGNSSRYIGAAGAGVQAWTYNIATGSRTLLGLTGAAFFGPGGEYRSTASGADADAVFGVNEVRNGSGTFSALSSIPWYYEMATGRTVELGLSGAEWTSTGGYRNTRFQFTGQGRLLSGQNQRFSAQGQDLGSSAWVHDRVTGVTRDVTLAGPQWTGADGSRTTTIQVAGANGLAGNARQYQQGTGVRAWYRANADAPVTIVGLAGTTPEWTSAGNFCYDEVFAVSDSGFVLGIAARYNTGGGGEGEQGRGTWVYNPSTGQTKRVGMIDAGHTLEQFTEDTYITAFYGRGGQASAFQGFPVGDFVAGASMRNVVTSIAPYYSGWVYQLSTDTTFPLVFSVATDGRANTDVYSISADGTAVGSYLKFAGNAALGSVYFYWSPTTGLFDAASLVSGGLPPGYDGISIYSVFPTSTTLIGRAVRPGGLGNDAATFTYSIVQWAAASGSWQTPANWQGGVSPLSPNPVVFAHAATYTVSLAADAAASALNVTAGDVTLDSASARLSLAGALRVGLPGISTTATLRLPDADLSAAAVYLYPGARLFASGSIGAPVTIDPGAALNTLPATTLVVGNIQSAGTIALAPDSTLQLASGTGTSVLAALQLAPSARLDIRDNDLVLRNADLAATSALVRAAYTGGVWTTPGIMSSLAFEDGLAVGYASNADIGLTNFGGVAVATSDFLIKYTWFGDADLNGQVDGDDYLLWLAVFGSSGGTIGWAQGDFDYDRDVDGDDYLLWLQNFGNGVGDPLAAVPEPGVLGAAVIGAAALLRRRRA